ncbi:MAG: type II toxin-antitoxin system HicB family antitoxin [Solirubrobacteraceae bacterium]|nr:type II toxin-antitoxin system HicB family antitoxin [Solirubrobacteraceae bacterium]
MPHIQIKDVPPELHERLREQAAAERVSLSAFLLRELEQIAGLPTVDEWLAQVRADPGRPRSPVSGAELVRGVRDEEW